MKLSHSYVFPPHDTAGAESMILMFQTIFFQAFPLPFLPFPFPATVSVNINGKMGGNKNFECVLSVPSNLI